MSCSTELCGLKGLKVIFTIGLDGDIEVPISEESRFRCEDATQV